MTWPGGGTVAHCSVAGCHQTFGDVAGFDAHRERRACLPAADIKANGFTRNGYGIWVKRVRPAGK